MEEKELIISSISKRLESLQKTVDNTEKKLKEKDGQLREARKRFVFYDLDHCPSFSLSSILYPELCKNECPV